MHYEFVRCFLFEQGLVRMLKGKGDWTGAEKSAGGGVR